MLGLKNALYLKILVSFTLLSLIAVQINWSEVVPSFLNTSLIVMGSAFAILTLQTLALGVRWHLIINTGRERMNYINALQITFAALIANFVFLTSISGLAVRIALTVRKNVSLLFAIGASLIDRLMTILALLILAAIFMPFAHKHIGTELIVISGSLLATCLMLFLGLLALSKTKYGRFLQSTRKTATTIKYMQSIFVRPVLFGSIISISLIAQLFYFFVIYILSHSMGLNLTFFELLTVLPMIALISSLPIGVGGWGVREGAFVYGLGLLGVGLEQAFLISIQVGLLGLVSATIIGLPAWFIQDKK